MHVKPIVNVAYWKHLFAALMSKKETPLPDYINFIPNLAEPELVASDFDFKMKTERKTLFQDKHFIVFGDSQYNSVLPIVKAAGKSCFFSNSFEGKNSPSSCNICRQVGKYLTENS